MIITTSNIDIADKITDCLGRLRRKPVILCIGSDRVTGDSLGPLVGHLLKCAQFEGHVYGSLQEPVTAINLVEVIRHIKRNHLGSKIIAIDSSIGAETQLGLISVLRGGLRPGAADGKNLPMVGDISITATVAAHTAKNLYTVRLGFVYELAKTIADSLVQSLSALTRFCSA